MIPSFSFHDYSLVTYYMPETVLGIGDIATAKTTQNPCSHGAYLLMGGKLSISK